MSPMRKGLLLLNSFQDQPSPQMSVANLRDKGRNEFGSWSILFVQGSNLGGQDQCGQATKGMWGMSWRQEAMKGVEDCEKPGGMVKRVLIPGSLNERGL